MKKKGNRKYIIMVKMTATTATASKYKEPS